MAQRTRREEGARARERTAPTRSALTRRLLPGRKGRDAQRSRRGPAGRYTAPTPRTVRHSPRWYPWVLLSLAVLGVLVIIVNYAGGFPKSPSNWYTLGALIALVAAALLATSYR